MKFFGAETDKNKSRYIEKRDGDEHTNKTGSSSEREAVVKQEPETRFTDDFWLSR